MDSKQAISYTSGGVVSISYESLKSSPLSLRPSIEEAFGPHPDALGLIIVRDLPPSYQAYRERLLKLSYRFAKLDDNIREKYADPATEHSFGWSYGKELMRGKPDLVKGYYYANPMLDVPDVSREDKEAYPQYYSHNIWPAKDEQGIEGFEEAYKNLGRFIFKVGCDLAEACQPLALSRLTDSSLSLSELIRTSQTTKARLLHYFPPPPGSTQPVDDEHVDHCLLTGLCSAMYLEDTRTGEPREVSSPSEKSGLYVRTRGGDQTKVSIPRDSLAFQAGEALEIATGNKLLGTPHVVLNGPSANADKISRETFALFMQPDTRQKISGTQTWGQFTKEIPWTSNKVKYM